MMLGNHFDDTERLFANTAVIGVLPPFFVLFEFDAWNGGPYLAWLQIGQFYFR